ncbi:MAG: metallophosphatase family protein [Gemmataceae bacterium]|nr:metallophosphatase family protein [Gemmataceae bacterium]
MRLGILSDTHDQLDRTRRAVDLLRAAGAEALVHCGDLTTPSVVQLLAGGPAWFVLGNHDSDLAPHLERAGAECGVDCLGWGGLVELAGRRIGITHGHLRSDVRRLLAEQPDYLLTGHLHVASDKLTDGVRRINPGALERADAFTVALLDVAGGDLQFLDVPS